jgi:hypothetical protein
MAVFGSDVEWIEQAARMAEPEDANTQYFIVCRDDAEAGR